MASPGPEDRVVEKRGGGGPWLPEGQARKRKRDRDRDRTRNRRMVHVGDEIHRWNRVKSQLNLQSDEAMARTLLDAFVKIHMSQSSPSQAVLEVCIGEDDLLTQATVRKEHEAVHNASPFWPSVAASKGRRLDSQSASWKMGRPRESKLRGKRSRSGRMARHRTSSCPVLPKTVSESESVGQAAERVPLGSLPLPVEEASRGKLRRDGLRRRPAVCIGDQVGRWSSVKNHLSLRSDEEMARILLDVFIEKCMNQPGPNLTVQEVGLDQEATGTCGSAKEDNEQCDLDSFPSLSAGSESTVTLSHPSSIGSFQDDTDADLFSGADSQSESNSKSPGRVRRRPERLPLPNHEAKEEEEWDSGSESNRFERCNSRKKEVDLRNEEMTSTVPANRLPAGPESQGTSHGEIIQVYIGEGGEPTCPAIKKEQEETCSLPSPVGSVGSESTVTLSHPSSDISFEDDCFLDTAVGSESETEGLGAVTNRKKPPALPDHEAKSRNAKWDQLGTLDIGEEFDRWNFMKDYLKLKSDEEMARVLLDLYTKTHAIPASPLTTLCAFVKKV